MVQKLYLHFFFLQKPQLHFMSISFPTLTHSWKLSKITIGHSMFHSQSEISTTISYNSLLCILHEGYSSDQGQILKTCFLTLLPKVLSLNIFPLSNKIAMTLIAQLFCCQSQEREKTWILNSERKNFKSSFSLSSCM